MVVVSGGVMQFDLTAGRAHSVGRSPNADIYIDSKSVSRAHALVNVADSRIVVTDLKSTNGTFVNGAPIGDDSMEVHVGDALRFGEVAAQLVAKPVSRFAAAKLLPPREFDVRLEEECERSARFDRALAFAAVELPGLDEDGFIRARGAVLSGLRALDVATVCGPGRVDAMLLECSKSEALTAVRRVGAELRSRGVVARLGVAVYPSHVASPESLRLAAQLAMRSGRNGEVNVAREGSRLLRVGATEVVVAEPAMVRLFATIERVASASLPVLVHGETGTGKEIIAEAIHNLGARRDQPLVKLNCAAVPEHLLESELFGHVRGAFTGADRAKEGLLGAVDGGTLFLDEIGDMPLALQPKLLRVLEDGMVRRIGATVEQHVDVRIVAATHRDLVHAVSEGRFREDLLYRLRAVVLELPPLRERLRELPLLAERFAADVRRESQTPVTISDEAMDLLRSYHWPGNVREPRNVLESAAVMCQGDRIEAGDLPEAVTRGRAPSAAPIHEDDDGTVQLELPPDLGFEEEVKAFQRLRITQALEKCGGNQTQAAKLLGIPRRTLVYKIKSLDIDVRSLR